MLVALLGSTSSLASNPRINLEVDATDVVRGIQHVRLVLPAHAGPMTLAYPEWIPGEHRPTGPITQLMNLHIEADAQDLLWRRDARDAFLFHLTVPAAARTLEVRFDFFSPPRSFGPGFGETPDATLGGRLSVGRIGGGSIGNAAPVAVERDKLAAMELRNSHEPRDLIERKRKLVTDKCPTVEMTDRWLVQWDGKSELLPEED
jgi:Peptidase M61 N-terminal domain